MIMVIVTVVVGLHKNRTKISASAWPFSLVLDPLVTVISSSSIDSGGLLPGGIMFEGSSVEIIY